jgi:acetyl-CoA carboxylase carboxyltransferase component
MRLVDPWRYRPPVPAAELVVTAPMVSTVVSTVVAEGDHLATGAPLVVLESMKLEHVVTAPADAVVLTLAVESGESVVEGQVLVVLRAVDGATASASASPVAPVAATEARADLLESRGRHEIGLDAARPDAVARRRAQGRRTTRENVADLVDDGSFVEYGPLIIAAQRRRRPLDDLIARTPADGLVAGLGSVNGDRFADEQARCAVLSYDYTVLAGTQGTQNHRKKDRLFELIERLRLPTIVFTEGGGGRPGDTDGTGVTGLDCMAFHLFARLSGRVPLVAINAGYCFAGNAALLGCCDVVIATADSSIGMGGPAMIEGGGLGVVEPGTVGPMSVQAPNGVVDVVVTDEAEAVRVAKQYLSYFQGPLPDWVCADQSLLRAALPESRLRTYDVRDVIALVADEASVLELRPTFGRGMITTLVRIEGRPLGLIANNPLHLAGAIDSDGADKAARFLQLCDAFGLPVVSLIDTPGMMVGPDAEATALVRHCSRLFVTGANLDVPVLAVVLRKAYGLGAQAMAGGSLKAPLFTVAWPSGEFGGMGLEGAVRLGFRRELDAIGDPAERQREYDALVARHYEHGKALNVAAQFEIDDVIDPADTRRWISAVLRSLPPSPSASWRTRPERRHLDTW